MGSIRDFALVSALFLALAVGATSVGAQQQTTPAAPAGNQQTTTPAQPSNTTQDSGGVAAGSRANTNTSTTAPTLAQQQTGGAAPNSSASPDAHKDCKPTTLCEIWKGFSGNTGCAIFFGILILVIVGLTAWLMWYSRPGSAYQAYVGKLQSAFFFWLDLGYLLLLIVFALLYLQVWTDKCPLLLGRLLPIAVPWFGALGAVLISLQGIFDHGQRNWDNNYNYWHIGRPLFGGVLGIVSFFLYVLLVTSSGAVPPFLQDKALDTMPKDYIIYYVVAFLVGYREETFRELIRRVTDMIFKPSTPAPDAPTVTFKVQGTPQTSLDFGAVDVNASHSITVEIVNSGKPTLVAPKAGFAAGGSTAFTIDHNNLSAGGDLKSGESRTLDVIFHPTAVGPASATLVITGTNSTSGAKLTLSGHA